jgi:hypothetical protein
MTEQRRDDQGIDPSVDAAWRQAAGDQPPAEIDAAILAAARAAVRRDAQERQPAPPPRRWASWQPLAAAAGVIGLSFLLVQMLPRDQIVRPPANRDASRAPAAESAPTITPPAAPPEAAVTDEAAIMSGEREATPGAAPRTALEAAAKQSVAARPESPAAWASRIAALHDAGDLAAAEAELRAFRAAHPDADDYLPEAVRVWATSVGRDGTP